MTREDIIAHMAIEVAMVDGTGESRVKEVLERFAALVVAEEREACAKVVEQYRHALSDDVYKKLERAIRLRGVE